MFIRAIFVIAAMAFFNAARAETYQYNADVKGMVCAFCAYSVSKNVSKLPGVDVDSVNVDLKGGHVAFRSTRPVAEKDVTRIFSSSGFAISHLREKRVAQSETPAKALPLLDLRVKLENLARFSDVMEAIGDVAANSTAHLVIHAPASAETSILKPVLMGRQQVIKIRYIPEDANDVHLQFFQAPGNNTNKP